MSKTVLLAQWTDEGAFRPADNIRRRLDAVLTVGAVYRLEAEEYQPRNANTHKHFFATLNDIWHSLPEGIAENYPAVEHLRKKLLVRCGFYHERTFAATSPENAAAVAALAEALDEYAVVVVADDVVRVFTAKSQATDYMDATEFRDAKRAVLAAAEALLEGGS